MNLLSDIYDFFGTLTFVDFVFFFAVIVLLILIITLIYFIKINEEVLNNNKTKTELEIINEAIIKSNEENKNNIASCEKEDDEQAIISYDELKNKKENYIINYSEEKEFDGLTIKKIDVNKSEMDNNADYSNNINVRVISYHKEEEFLKVLKELKLLLD